MILNTNTNSICFTGLPSYSTSPSLTHSIHGGPCSVTNSIANLRYRAHEYSIHSAHL